LQIGALAQTIVDASAEAQQRQVPTSEVAVLLQQAEKICDQMRELSSPPSPQS
jgi:hypothetical protein